MNYWDIAKKLQGRTLRTQKANTAFEILDVTAARMLLKRSATGTRHSYSREKVEKYCAHRARGGAITIKSLYRAGIEKNPHKGEYSYIPAIVDEILLIQQISKLPGWSYSWRSRSISTQLKCKNFMAAVRLINKIARLAEKADHHPDLHLTRYRRLRIVLTTHSAGKVTGKDLSLALKISKLIPRIPGPLRLGGVRW